MDMTAAITPRSDQLDAVDLLGGPQTFTITGVRAGNDEQPVQIDLAEFPRPWRPGKSMSRVLVAAWGKNATAYIGHRLTLWCDPRVKFGGEAVGGIRITHMDGIADTLRVPLLVSKGKSGVYLVQPLTEAPALTPETIAAETDEAKLRGWWAEHPGQRQAITDRVAALREGADQ